jgi:hypothetical protein
MAADKPPLRARRWTTPPLPGRASSSRLLFRLIAIPALAFAGVLIYRGVQERVTLPDCDSSRAKSTLAQVLDPLKAEPLRDDAIRTVSSRKDEVACHVTVPAAGATFSVDYSFFWQGHTAEMRYSISRQDKQQERQDVAPPATGPAPQAPVR